jgi:serine-type D-Ala-D-Ala carboxypeptidase (penicillin-binding protein 5/6)
MTLKKILTAILLLTFFCANTMAFAASPPSVVADGALLVDMNTGSVLYSRNMDTKFYPASTTKIMTALLVLEKCKLTDKVIIGKNPSSFVDGNKIYLFKDEEFTVDQLLHALLIESANDVAIAFAEHISGSVENFAKLMTERAKELGCKNTNFSTPNGLDDNNNYTTAYDLSLIAREAMKNETFREIVSTKSYTMPPTNKQPKERPLYTNNNILLNTKFHVDGANGMKVGYTDIAGHSFVGTAFRGDTHLMVVLLHDKKPGMWEDASSLLNYGFDNYKTIKQLSSGDVITKLKVTDSKIEVPLTATSDFYYTRSLNESSEINSSIVITNQKIGSILKGENMGYIEYFMSGTEIGKVDLTSAIDLPSTFLYDYKKDANSNIERIYSSWLLLPALAFLALGILSSVKIIRNKGKSSI